MHEFGRSLNANADDPRARMRHGHVEMWLLVCVAMASALLAWDRSETSEHGRSPCWSNFFKPDKLTRQQSLAHAFTVNGLDLRIAPESAIALLKGKGFDVALDKQGAHTYESLRFRRDHPDLIFEYVEIQWRDRQIVDIVGDCLEMDGKIVARAGDPLVFLAALPAPCGIAIMDERRLSERESFSTWSYAQCHLKIIIDPETSFKRASIALFTISYI